MSNKCLGCEKKMYKFKLNNRRFICKECLKHIFNEYDLKFEKEIIDFEMC